MSCECGCGQQTTISPASNKFMGYTRGIARRFVVGHSRAKSMDARYALDPEKGCWIWRGGKNSVGYGIFNTRGDRRIKYAHRFFFARAKGPIPDGWTVDHLCRRPACVNPAHLEAVTHRENIIRGAIGVKLNSEAAKVIKHQLKNGRSPDWLARLHNVGVKAVDRIAKGETWAWI